MPEARAWAAEDLRAGLTAEFTREITEQDVLAFARNSGDENPLHVDAEYARTTNYRARLVHGAFQVGLASALIGMHLPGKRVLLGSVQAKFPGPLYFPCQAHVRGELTAWNAQTTQGTVKVIVSEANSRIATAEVYLGVTLHQQGTVKAVQKSQQSALLSADRRVVLVTGASGGLGSALVRALANEYTVLAQVFRNPLPDDLRGSPHVRELQADWQGDGWSQLLTEALHGQPLYGVVFAGWPGMARGGLLQTADEVIESQLTFGTLLPIRLARLLDQQTHGLGGRMVVIGSIAGGAHPNLAVAPYSLGKATLETTVRLLAPELARKQITINALCPSFIATGMNRHANDRQQLREAASIPMGRLCTEADVVQAVQYLLSPGAEFVSGQIIGLAGGQL